MNLEINTVDNSEDLKFFDCHLHIEKGLENYDLPLTEANVIFNSVKSFKENTDKFSQFNQSLIFDFKNHLDFVLQTVVERKVSALKIHSRIQKLKDEDYEELFAILKQEDIKIPIIYDAFYYGGDWEYQPSLSWLIKLIKANPNRKIIVAHSGGYELLKYFFHLRPFDNVYYDLSFSLQYLKDTSVFTDLLKLVKFTDKNRIMFGSDFPYSSPKEQMECLQQISDYCKISKSDFHKMIYGNALTIF